MFVETLTPTALALLGRIGGHPDLDGFYLAGVSAAALHLGHRVSVDLDFFTTRTGYREDTVQSALGARRA